MCPDFSESMNSATLATGTFTLQVTEIQSAAALRLLVASAMRLTSICSPGSPLLWKKASGVGWFVGLSTIFLVSLSGGELLSGHLSQPCSDAFARPVAAPSSASEGCAPPTKSLSSS